MLHKNLIIFTLITILCFNLTKGSDTYDTPIDTATDCTSIVPFNYPIHIAQTRKILEEGAGLLVLLPIDAQKRETEIKELSERFDVRSHNGYIMSLTKIIPDSLHRVVAVANASNKVKGIMDFYVRAEDKQGYIETLSVKVGYTVGLYTELIKYALNELQKMKVSQVYTDVLYLDIHGQSMCKLLGFKKIKTENDSVSYQYTFDNINNKSSHKTKSNNSSHNDNSTSPGRLTQEVGF